MCSQGMKNGRRGGTSRCSSSFFTHQQILKRIILLFIQQSWDVHLHVHLQCSALVHSFTSLIPLFFCGSSHLFESRASSLRQVRTQKAFYLFILSSFHHRALTAPPGTDTHKHTHTHTHTPTQNVSKLKCATCL